MLNTDLGVDEGIEKRSWDGSIACTHGQMDIWGRLAQGVCVSGVDATAQ